MVNYTDMFSEKGHIFRVIDGYKFSFHKRLKNGQQRFKCTKNSCKCYVVFNTDGTAAVDKTQGHNHNLDAPEDLVRQKTSNALKQKATENLLDKPCKIIRRALLENGSIDLTQSEVQRIRKNMNEARRKVRQPLPTTLAALHISLNCYDRMTTIKGENMVLVNDSHKNIIIFSTASNLKYLSLSPTILVDSTFKSVPALFTQLFVIHGLRFGRYVPLVFCRLPSKESVINEAAFHYIVAEAIDMGLQMVPEVCYIDFEEGIHTAVRSIWPACTIRGCRFHLGQSWWCHIQSVSLTQEYKNPSRDIGNYLKLFFGLPFLHPSEVKNCFIHDLLPMTANMRVKKFTDYIFWTYISPTAKFPPTLWAEYSHSIARTTNSCQSFHSHFNADFYTAHPNIFIFIQTLMELQSEIYSHTKIQGMKQSKRNSKSVAKEKNIATLMTRRDLGELDRLEFIRKLTFKFLPIRP